MYGPIEQFNIFPLLYIYNNIIELTISNSTIYLLISTFLMISIIYFSINKNILNNRFSLIIKNIYVLFYNQIYEILGEKGIKYFIFIFNIFLFILINNIVGLIPYSYTTTSNILLTFTMSNIIIIGITIIGLKNLGFNFY